MKSLIKLALLIRPVAAVSAATLALGVSTPGYAMDKSLAACMAEAETLTVANEAINGTVDVAAQVADVGLPVMDAGIVLSLNQVNANLADLIGPVTMIAKSTCDMNDTLSSSPSATAFIGWIDAEDTEPLPTLIPTQIDGTLGLASPMARMVDAENTTSVRLMEANLKDGYSAALLDNQGKGLANMEGTGLTSIANEKLAIVAAAQNVARLKSADNLTDLMAMHGVILNSLYIASMRANIIAQQQDLAAQQRERFHMNQRQMIRDDHLATATLLSAGI